MNYEKAWNDLKRGMFGAHMNINSAPPELILPEDRAVAGDTFKAVLRIMLEMEEDGA